MLNIHTTITGTRHVLAVQDLETSVRYYQEKLGFTSDWAVGGWRQLSRDNFVVMLGECSDDVAAFDTRNHAYFGYVDVEGVDALHAELVAKGVEIHYPLQSQPWGQREFGIRTVDGHRIIFGEALATPPS
jgi:uncharacterized glyoxalase superfamily protein PhnB